MATSIEKLETKLAKTRKSSLPPVEKCAAVGACHWALAEALVEAEEEGEKEPEKTARLTAAFEHARAAERLGGLRFDYPFFVAQLAHLLGHTEEAGRSIKRCITTSAEEELLADVAGFLAEAIIDNPAPIPDYLEALAKLLVDCPECVPASLRTQIAATAGTTWASEKVALALAKRAHEIDPSRAFLLRAQAATESDPAKAARLLEEYVARIPDPYFQAQAIATRVAVDPEIEIVEIPIFEDWPSAQTLYNAATTLQQSLKGASAKSRLWIQKAATSYYDIALRRFETHFTTGRGTPEDSDAHIYSMCCRNRAMLHRSRGELAEAILLHGKGIEASPFYEHYDDRSGLHFQANDPFSASADSLTLLTEYLDDLEIGKVLVHLFRALSGLTQAKKTDEALLWAERAIELVQDLDAEDRAANAAQIPILYELAARAYRQAGNGRRALELTNHPDAKPGANHDRLVMRAAMEKVVALQGAGRFPEALATTDEILKADPAHMWAWATRIFILFPLRSATRDPAEIARLTAEIEETYQAPLRLLRSKYLALPQLQESVRTTWQRALNGVAWSCYESSNDPAALEDAIGLVDRGLSADVKDDRSYMLDTQVRILMKLGRTPEAFAIADAALTRDPTFGDFQDIKADAAFETWKKSRGRKKVAWRHHFLEKEALAAQSSPAVLFTQALLESHPVLDPFGARPAPFDPGTSAVLERILALPAASRAEVLDLATARDPLRIPELAELDNIFGPTNAHQLMLETLVKALSR